MNLCNRKCILTMVIFVTIAVALQVSYTYSFAADTGKINYFTGADDKESLLAMENAANRIENLRKKNFSVRFVNHNGSPVKGKANISLIHHEFPFGAAITQTLRLPDNHPAKFTAIKVNKDLFSRVTINNFWGFSQKQRGGEFDFRLAEKQVNYALSNNFDIRFHALIYIRNMLAPHWANEVKTTDEWWPLIEQRIKAVADKFGENIAVIDVINEIFYHYKWRKKNIPNFPNQYDPEVIAKMFKIARIYFPKTKLIILEQFYPTMHERNKKFKYYYLMNKKLIELGTPYDGIGFQAHFYTEKPTFSEGSWMGGPDTFKMKEIEKGLDHLASLGKDIYITEFSPPSRNNKKKGIQAHLTDEEIADWTVNFYTLAFSKPYIKELVRWFLIDEIGGRGMDAGLVDKKGQLKPAYFALNKLLTSTWSTNWSGRLVNGEAKFRGFYGDYKAFVDGKEVLFKLSAGDNGNINIVVSN